MPFIDQKELFEKTDGGRLVIEHYYPQSADSFARYPQNRLFKCRLSEKTASAAVKRMPDGVWIVTDFGDDSKSRNCIQVVMFEEKVEFKQALDLIAALFNIVPDEQRSLVIKPEIRQRDADKEEVSGKWDFVTRPFTYRDLQQLLAPKVLEYLAGQVKQTKAEEQETEILAEVTRIFEKYHFHALEKYVVIKDRKATEIRATDIYPIYMFDEGDWKKIYQPKAVNGADRFRHYPKDVAKPKDYVFGYDVARAAYDEVVKVQTDDSIDEAADDEPKKKKKKPKLKNIFICSGGSDGLNIAVVGQAFGAAVRSAKKDAEKAEVTADSLYPVWLNSETGKLSAGNQRNLAALCENLYNIPDIDATGMKAAHALALEYLEIKTLYLPEELRQKVDTFRKKPLKDLRDYFKYYKVYDFFTLVKKAYPYRFWDAAPPTPKSPKWTYSVNNKHLYNFLSRSGFYRFETEAEKDGYIYIQIDGNIVRKIDPKRIRDYVNQFIETRNPDVELMNTFLRTNQLNEGSLSNLPFIQIDFTDFDKENQWFFFNNNICQVTRDGITAYKPGTVHKYVWEDEVVNRKLKPLEPMFTIGVVQNITTKDETLDIALHNTDCLVLRYLINTSRIFWREELETRLDGIADEKAQGEYAIHHQFTETDMHLLNGKPKADREAYAVNHQFDIAGPLLTAREQQEQKLQLINKIFMLGYMFHRHKEEDKAWAVWTMDAKVPEGDESLGGTGKSLLPMLIYNYKLIRAQYRGGRDPKLTENPHIYEGIDKHTDLLIIDDCNRYLKFDFFFPAITGPLNINPKNAKQFIIPFEDTPKIWFTSNFPPQNIDDSKERRILYNINSDYYHSNASGEYREERRVSDDFKKIIGRGFNETEWNLALNFFMQCTQFYLSCTQKINPPMDNVNKRNLKSTMGDLFEPWADVYFSKESGRLNSDEVIKDDAVADYLKSSNQKHLTSQRFKKQLKAWCAYHNIELNPKDMCTAGGQIIKAHKWTDQEGKEHRGAKEILFLKTREKTASQKVIDKYNTEKGKELATAATEDECPI